MAPLIEEKFAKLLKKLVSILRASAGNREIDIPALAEEIRYVESCYLADGFMKNYASNLTLHDIAKPLARIISFLEREGNHHAVSVAILNNVNREKAEAIEEDLKNAEQRQLFLISDLKAIAASLKSRPKAAANRPPNLRLRLLVGHLLHLWSQATGKSISQGRNQRASQFVYAVVSAIGMSNRFQARPPFRFQ